MMPSLISFVLLLALSYPVLAQDATAPATTRKEKIQTRVETTRDARKENAADRVTATKERVATKEAALKARLEAFKDKKKAEVVEKVNKNLNNINQKMTGQMLKHLERMTSILTKLEARVNSAKPDVKNVAAAKAAIADAKASIASASAAVSSQAEIDYTITISSETKVKGDVQKVREQLHTDLKAVRKLVIDAKQAVANAIRVAKSGPSNVKEGTPSGR